MSFDVHLQRYLDGEWRPGGNDLVRAALEGHLVRGGGEITHVSADDGDAEVYGLDGEDGFMATHIDGTGVWDLLVLAARAAELVILPVGCPTCVVDPAQVQHLPPELREDVVVVADGAELLHAVRTA